ncbi:MAG: hypothetical protein HYT81_13135 [Gemmatimonadetes bacterium]|nr:hypothetical protein [Gemmatimonadota bacterium]
MMRKTVCALALALITLAGSAAAQEDAWQHRWFWGAQAGIMRFQTPTASGWQDAITAGGHWLITSTHSALYAAFDHVIFKDNTSSAVVDASSPTGIRNIDFTNGRRIQALLYIFPTDGFIQPYLGGGFGIHQLTDASPAGGPAAFATPQQFENILRVVDETSTKAFPIFSGGLQLRFGRLALFGQGQYMPLGRNYLISSAQYVGSVGLRYALTSSREEVTARR